MTGLDIVGGASPPGTEYPDGMLEPGAGRPAGLVRPSAPAVSLTAQLHASGLNGVLAAKEPATTAEAVPTSMPCETRSRRLLATPASAAATRMLTSRGASGSRSFKRFAIICELDKAATPYTGLETMARSAFCASSPSSHWGLTTLTPPTRPDDTGFIVRTRPAAARGFWGAPVLIAARVSLLVLNS